MRPQDAETFRDVLDNHLRLVRVCHPCHLWVRIDVGLLVRLGRGEQEIGSYRSKCRRCGRPNQLAVLAPAGPSGDRPSATSLRFPTL